MLFLRRLFMYWVISSQGSNISLCYECKTTFDLHILYLAKVHLKQTNSELECQLFSPHPSPPVFDTELLLQPSLFLSCAESQNYTDAQPPTPVATTTHRLHAFSLLSWLTTDIQTKPRDSKLRSISLMFLYIIRFSHVLPSKWKITVQLNQLPTYRELISVDNEQGYLKCLTDLVEFKTRAVAKNDLYWLILYSW